METLEVARGKSMTSSRTVRMSTVGCEHTVGTTGKSYLMLRALRNTNINLILSSHFDLAVELVQLHNMLVVVNAHARLKLFAKFQARNDGESLLFTGGVYKRKCRLKLHLVADSF